MSNNNLTLHGPDYSTFTRTLRICMAEKGLNYEHDKVDLLSGQHQSASIVRVIRLQRCRR